MPEYYGLNTDNNIKKSTTSVEIGIGSEFEMGVLFKRNFNKYLSWDILHAKYAVDYIQGETNDYYYGYYDNGNLHELSFTTGIRAYTPRIGKKLKFFTALDLGYGLAIQKKETPWNSDRDNWSQFVMDLTLGAYIGDKFYIGYGYGGNFVDVGSHTDHLLRVGLDF